MLVLDEILIARTEKDRLCLCDAVRIHAVRSLHHHLCLISSDRRPVSDQLAVQIRFVNNILVNENQVADPDSDKRFSSIRSDAAYTKYSDSLRGKKIYPFLTHNAGSTYKYGVHYSPPGMISIQ